MDQEKASVLNYEETCFNESWYCKSFTETP